MEREILHTLDIVGPASVEEIAHRLNRHPICVDQACDYLQREGTIRLGGGDQYRLTDIGVDTISSDYPSQETDRRDDQTLLQEK